MPPLRFPWLWWSVGCLLVAAVVGGSLVSLSADVVGFSLNDKLLHAGCYLILMLWFAGLYLRRHHIVVGLILFALGLLLDLAQILMPERMFDLSDVAANGAGILVGLILARFVLEGWCWRFEQLVFAR